MIEFDPINNARDIFLEEIHELEGNGLEFTLVIGKTAEEESSVLVGNVDLKPVHQIYYDDNSPRYRIKFESYVGYSVLKETYTNIGDDGKFEGDKVRKYSESNFLNYIRKDTFAHQIYSESSVYHYFFTTLSHLINVASAQQPIIEKLNTNH
jgi:hypothetical protein